MRKLPLGGDICLFLYELIKAKWRAGGRTNAGSAVRNCVICIGTNCSLIDDNKVDAVLDIPQVTAAAKGCMWLLMLVMMRMKSAPADRNVQSVASLIGPAAATDVSSDRS